MLSYMVYLSRDKVATDQIELWSRFPRLAARVKKEAYKDELAERVEAKEADLALVQELEAVKKRIAQVEAEIEAANEELRLREEEQLRDLEELEQRALGQEDQEKQQDQLRNTEELEQLGQEELEQQEEGAASPLHQDALDEAAHHAEVIFHIPIISFFFVLSQIYDGF